MIVVLPEAPAPLVATAPCLVERISTFEPEDLRACASRLRAAGVEAAVTDCRSIGDDQLAALQAGDLRTYCVDELGGRALHCAGVFNPVIVEARHRYAGNSELRIYAGPDYFPLGPEYAKWGRRPRVVDGDLSTVVVTMGGVDRSGATLRVFDILDRCASPVEKHVVLGAAFAWPDAMEERLRSARSRWHVHRGLPTLASLIGSADAAITAGGNTLYELACVGTPAITLHEDPHEEEQARAFEARGFGTWVGRGADADAQQLVMALERLQHREFRRAQSAAGRRIVDGRGGARICDLIRDELLAAA